MKQLVVLSGKGGAGKTSISAAFAHLAVSDAPRRRIVMVDADVDAANLELVLSPRIIEQEDFRGGQTAQINQSCCSGCGECEAVCRFDAIHPTNGVYKVDPMSCEGCAACLYQCPHQAIEMKDQVVGEWFHSDSRFGPLFHAELRPAQENSGKLVALIKQQALQFTKQKDYDLLLVDGSPGIGCPVIAAASGADLALIVAEPTVSGIHDMQRIFQTTNHFGLKSIVCINKADIYPHGADDIEEYCQEHDLSIVGRVPYDESIIKAIVNGEPVTAFLPDCIASQVLIDVWGDVLTELEGTRATSKEVSSLLQIN